MIKGLGNVKKELDKSANILKLKNGESKVIRILSSADDIIAAYEHTEQIGGFWRTIVCPGGNQCPLCQSGKRPAFRAFIPVLDRTDGSVKIFKANKKTVVYIIGLVEEYGDITARDFKLARVGDGLDTTYQLFARDPSKQDLKGIELPDIEAMARTTPREEIEKLLENLAPDTDEVKEDELPF